MSSTYHARQEMMRKPKHCNDIDCDYLLNSVPRRVFKLFSLAQSGIAYQHVQIYPSLVQAPQQTLDGLRVREVDCLNNHPQHWQSRMKFLCQFGQAFCTASYDNQAVKFWC